MKYSIKAFIRSHKGGYMAECLEVDASASARTFDETVERLRHEICLRLRDADMGELGLVDDPTLFITFEDVPLSGEPLHCALQQELL